MNIDNIAEEKWKRDKAGQEVSGLVDSDRTLIRKIDQLSIKDIPALVEILRQRTSVKNPDDGQKYYSVENPKVDGVEQPGVWRGVTIRGIEDPAVGPAGTIQQVLAYGWATSISWAEARLGQGLEMQPEGADDYKFLTVIFPNIATDKMHALAATLADEASFTNPVIYGVPHDGVWYNSGVATGFSKDGSGIITLNLSIQYRDIPFRTTEITSDAVTTTRQQLGVTTETQEPMVETAGAVLTQEVRLNKDSSKDVITRKALGVTQENTTAIVSPSGKTTISEKTVQASALATPEAERGKIKRIVNRVSRFFNRYETTEELTVPADQTVTVVNKDYGGTTTTVKHTENATDLAVPDLARNQVVKIDAERTPSGNQRSIVSTFVPNNLTEQLGAADTFVETAQQREKQVTWSSMAELQTKILDILANARLIRTDAIPAYLKLVDGEAGELTVKENEAGNKEIALRLDTTKTTTSTEIDEKDVFSTKSVTETTGAIAKAGVSSFAAGTIKTVVNKWMRFKSRYLTTTTTDTANDDIQVTKPGSSYSADGTIYYKLGDTSIEIFKRYYNQTNCPSLSWNEIATIGKNTDARIEGLSLNKYGRFDYTKVFTIHNAPRSGSSGTWTTTGGYFWLPSIYNTDGSLNQAKQYQRSYAHALSFHLSLADACAASSGGMQGSSVYRLGDYLFASHKITQNTPTYVGFANFGVHY